MSSSIAALVGAQESQAAVPLLATVSTVLNRDLSNQNVVTVTIDGSDTSCTCIVPFDYTPTIGDRLLVQRVGALMYCLTVILAQGAGPYVNTATNPSVIHLTTTAVSNGVTLTAPNWPSSAFILHVMDCNTVTTGAGTTIGNVYLNAGSDETSSNIHDNSVDHRETSAQGFWFGTLEAGDTLNTRYHQTGSGASDIEGTHTRLIGIFFPR